MDERALLKMHATILLTYTLMFAMELSCTVLNEGVFDIIMCGIIRVQNNVREVKFCGGPIFVTAVKIKRPPRLQVVGCIILESRRSYAHSPPEQEQ